MYSSTARLCSTLIQRDLPALCVSKLGSPVKNPLKKRSSPASLYHHSFLDSRISKPVPTKAASRSLVCSSTAYSMGGSTSRLYSALALPLRSAPPAGAEPRAEPGAGEEPADPEALLKECEEALRNRPARLHRDFVFPDGDAPLSPPIRVMQWNILAQALGEGKDDFVECPLDALNWAERKYLILEEILTYRPDILCLQEVDHYFDTFQPVLGSLGYHGTFCPKPWSPCLDVERNNGPDGCALFFRRDRFLLQDSACLRLSAQALETNQVAIVQTLRCRATGRPLRAAVTHLKARSGWEGLRSAQGSDLLRSLREAGGGGDDGGGGDGAPLLVCGDFNAEPGEDVYRLFSTSGLGLDSAYKRLSADGRSEPPYTTWKIRPSGESRHTLDYIWYSRRGLRVDSVLDLPSEEQIGPGRLPSYSYPSDHLSLVCDVRFQDDPDRLQ
ncbi:nocturnin-like isoform X1 [Anguilla anguilla]|uniref:nocturnin-like isoform X1 n=2 Tax=Anguilla anguilla TaxID=7936 RepID=UPI0015AB74D7|nr:nocturnin-like isoform X1 [Anguilla anguilla]